MDVDSGAVVAIFGADFVFDVAWVVEVEGASVLEEEGEFRRLDIDLAAIHKFWALFATSWHVFVGYFLQESVEFRGFDALVAFVGDFFSKVEYGAGIALVFGRNEYYWSP